MKTNGDAAAFAVAIYDLYGDHFFHAGLSKREYFAAMTMQGIISSNDFKTYGYSDLERAASAVRCADDLIASLNEEKKG